MRSSQALRQLRCLLSAAPGCGPTPVSSVVGNLQAALVTASPFSRVGTNPLSLVTALAACTRSFSTQRALSAGSPWLAQLTGHSCRSTAVGALNQWGGTSTGSSKSFQTSAHAQQEFVSLNNLQDNEGARRWAKRIGRGVGSGKGKTAGRGHKGQKARAGNSPKLGFEGGQTPLRLRVPKRGFNNPDMITWSPINLERIQKFVAAGRLDPSSRITMKDLRDSGAVGKRPRHGFKLLAKGADKLAAPLHIEVSQVSAAARAAVEAAGGSVTTVYYNKLGLHALMKPSWFVQKERLLPRVARPPPKLEGRFDRVGTLPADTDLPASPRSV